MSNYLRSRLVDLDMMMAERISVGPKYEKFDEVLSSEFPFRFISGHGLVQWARPRHKIKVLTDARSTVDHYFTTSSRNTIAIEQIMMVPGNFSTVAPNFRGRWSFFTDRMWKSKDNELVTKLFFELEEDAIAAKMAIGGDDRETTGKVVSLQVGTISLR